MAVPTSDIGNVDTADASVTPGDCDAVDRRRPRRSARGFAARDTWSSAAAPAHRRGLPTRSRGSPAAASRSCASSGPRRPAAPARAPLRRRRARRAGAAHTGCWSCPPIPTGCRADRRAAACSAGTTPNASATRDRDEHGEEQHRRRRAEADRCAAIAPREVSPASATPPTAKSSPSAPPHTDSSTLSAMIGRATSQRPAPSATRTAISRRRLDSRARRRLAMLAQTISSRKPTAPISTMSAGREAATSCSCAATTRARPALVAARVNSVDNAAGEHARSRFCASAIVAPARDDRRPSAIGRGATGRADPWDRMRAAPRRRLSCSSEIRIPAASRRSTVNGCASSLMARADDGGIRHRARVPRTRG